jgi:hypothetical protein
VRCFRDSASTLCRAVPRGGYVATDAVTRVNLSRLAFLQDDAR